ncbi:MAG TPA: J domain-containing protein [Ilumatobacteraceae bacterium]
MATHYDVLGVPHGADSSTIRDAYRRLAREHHPDRGGAVSADRMAAVNEAYRVLGDPARRAAYDRSLRRGTTTPPQWSASTGQAPTAPPRPDEPLTPARVPWKLMAGMFVLGVIVVLAGAVLFEPADAPGPDGVLQPGSCVRIEINNIAREVECSGSDDLVVDRLITRDASCPVGTAKYPDSQGLGAACIVRDADG